MTLPHSVLFYPIAGTMLFASLMVLLPSRMTVFFNYILFGPAAANLVLDEEALLIIRVYVVVCGAVMLGWMTAFLSIINLAANCNTALNQKCGERVIMQSVVTWFVVDSTASLLYGAAGNALLNLGMFSAFVLAYMLT